MRNRHTSVAEKPLSSAVSISRQFLRSIRIDADYGRSDALSGYVCQATARALLEGMAAQLLGTRQRAFTWTGPYGGGKSSLALVLCSLVGGNPKLRQQAKDLLDLPPDSPVFDAFAARHEGWHVLPIVGRRGSVDAAITDSMSKLAPPRKTKRDLGAISQLVRLAESSKRGVLVIIDELGKFLEASAQGAGDDIYFFQQLAEAASRCQGELIVVGILHQAFDAYATRLGRDVRDDWAKVQGRYVDIPLVAASDETIELIGKAITVAPTVDRSPVHECVHAIASSIRTRRPSSPISLEESLASCWPLHPVTAALLGPSSKRKFGQNERSTFGFLASREPNGFLEFLESHRCDPLSMYEPARYWDYLKANLEPAILASPDGHRWAVGADAVERAEAKGTPIHVQLTKAVALIELFRNGSGLAADEGVLSVSVHAETSDQVRSALHDLLRWKVLIERKHLGAYGVFAGSDFDIESAVTAARVEIGVPPLEQAVSLTSLQPVLGKRLYAQTGTMHWFTRKVIRLSDLSVFVEKFEPEGASAGSFVLCLFDSDISEQLAKAAAKRASANCGKDSLIVGVPSNGTQIAELALELSATERVLKTRPELEGDSVARRELVGRIAAVRGALETEMGDAFLLATWFWRGERVANDATRSLSATASHVASTIFHAAPHIFSELINREDPSSNSHKARRDLLVRMISSASKPKLGYDGFPADAGLYFTVLNALGLHRQSADGSWGFYAPTGKRAESVRELWGATKSFVEGGKGRSLAEVYELWRAPPFGLRAGVMPIFSLAFYLAHRAQLALYIGGVFSPELTETVLDEWLLSPNQVLVKFVPAAKERAGLVRAVANTLELPLGTPIAEPLDVARALVSIVVALPAWAKRTTTVSEAAQHVRAMLLRASDPHKVIFADLPTLLGENDPERLGARVHEVTQELRNSYGRMLSHVRDHVVRALDHTGRSNEQLQIRARGVKGTTGDFRLDAFAAHLEAYDGSDQSIEGLVSLAVSKPPAAWVDRDIDGALLQLSAWALDFRRAEALAPLRGRPRTRRVFGVVFGTTENRDVSGTVDIDEQDGPRVQKLVEELLTSLRQKEHHIALAALAEVGATLVQGDSTR